MIIDEVVLKQKYAAIAWWKECNKRDSADWIIKIIKELQADINKITLINNKKI